MDKNNNQQGKELKTLQEINEGLGELLGRSSSLVSGKDSRSGSRYADRNGSAGQAGSSVGPAGGSAPQQDGGADGGSGSAQQETGMQQGSGAGISAQGSGSLRRGNAPQGNGLLRQSSDDKSGRYNKKRPLKLHGAVIFLIVTITLILAAVGIVFFLQQQGRKSLLDHEGIEGVEITAPEDAVIAEGGQIVRYKGKTYQRNTAVVSILGMGIDKDADEVYQNVMEQLNIGQKGQADTIFVAALDTMSGALNLINISRDAMTDVDVYNVDGEYTGTREMQICLAYAYGENNEKSCENVMKSVSRLMYGMPMDAYGAIDIPAISVLNDAVGGVQVKVLEDLTAKDPELVKGNVVTLKGNQATTYVRSRDYNALDANNARMQRQRQYVVGFIRQVFAKARRNISIVLTLYQAAQAYMTTDIDVSRLTYLVSLALQKNFTDANIMNVAGEIRKGSKYAEYYVDDEALYELILKIYYREIDDDGNIVIPAENIPEETEAEEPEEEESEKIITVDRDVLV